MTEPWSVRRARYAGEALRPPRKTTSEDHDDDAFPASRDERSAERSRRAASAAPAPRLGPILALVTRRDRVQHVYCKRTNETVPCVAIRLADDTFDGLRVVLWRAHAAADVGVGDVLEAVGLRARWNAYHDEPELASGYGASLVVRATASALLYAQLVSPPGHDTKHESHESRARAVEAWALEHRASLVRAAALAAARLTNRCWSVSERFINASAIETTARRANVSGTANGERVTPTYARNTNANGKQQTAFADVCATFSRPNELSLLEVSAADLRLAAESSGRAPCFSGRVVDAVAAASRRRRESDGGATKRVTAWVAQDSSGASTEVTLSPMTATDAEALARRLPGRAVRFTNFLVFEKVGSDFFLYGGGAPRAYALVQPDDTRLGLEKIAHTDGTAVSSAWCVLPEGDARAEDLEARCLTRRASAEAPSLRSLADFASVRPLSPPSFLGINHRALASSFELGGTDTSDASVVVVRARVAWVRLPQPPSAERAVFADTKKRKKERLSSGGFARRFKSARGVPATRAEVAASLVAPGCVLCLRELAPDPADETLRLFRQCACHSGRANAVGWVWRALELGLVDADEDEDGSRDSRDSRVISLQKVRVARVDASLVSRLLLGASAAAAAAAARDEVTREEKRGGEDPKPRKRMSPNAADGETDHLSLATAAINALAAGPARNATPFAWHLRAPPPDSNGVRFADGAPLEVVDFVATKGKAA